MIECLTVAQRRSHASLSTYPQLSRTLLAEISGVKSLEMKRILIFSLAYYPRFVGGAEVAIREITDRIDPQDIEFTMVTLRFDSLVPRVERVGNVAVYRVGFGRKHLSLEGSFHPLFYLSKICFVPLAAYTAWRLHREKRFDAFWAMMAYMLFPIVLLRMAGIRIPYALTLQEGDPFERVFSRPLFIPLRPLLRSGFRRARVLQAISGFLAAWGREMGFSGAVEVIPNGVDVARFSKKIPARELAAFKKELGKAKDDIYLITTSRLVHKNAVDDVIRALVYLPAHVHFLVLGGGPERTALERLAKELRVADRVRFFGFIPHEDMPRYLKASDIFVRPSRSEGMGNSFVEAMAAGLPVVATQEGGIADFLFDAVRNPGKKPTGFAVSADSPEEIARTVKEIMGNQEAAAEVVGNAAALVQERYEWSRIASAMRERVFMPLID